MTQESWEDLEEEQWKKYDAIDEASFLRSTQRRIFLKRILLGALLLLPFAVLSWRCWDITRRQALIAERRSLRQKRALLRLKLSPEEQKEVEQRIDELQRTLQTWRTHWQDTMREENLRQLSPTNQPCMHDYRPPTRTAVASYIKHGSIDANYIGNMLHFSGKSVVHRYRPGAWSPRWIHRKEMSLQRIKRRHQQGRSNRKTLNALKRLLRNREELIFVGQETAPLPTMLGESFTPGRIYGSVYLYSHPNGRIRCMTRVDVRNSPKVNIRYSYMKGNVFGRNSNKRASASRALRIDLEVNLVRAVASQLKIAQKEQVPMSVTQPSKEK